MARTSWHHRVVIDAELDHGEPCIRGTRIPVCMIIGSLADGMSSEEIRREYPQLAPEDIQAALSYAAEVLHQEVLIPLT